MLLYSNKRERLMYREDLPTTAPAPTSTWQPVAHAALANRVAQHLDGAGHTILEEEHAISLDGARYFGTFALPLTDSSRLVIGIRNCHDKRFAVGICAGSSVLVCSNLLFSGDELTMTRKHTRHVWDTIDHTLAHISRDAINSMCHNLVARENRLRETELRRATAHDLIMLGLRAGAYSAQTIPQIVGDWRSPRNPAEEGIGTAWALEQAVTHALKKYTNQQIPQRSRAWARLIDSYSFPQ